ncbi:DUF6262 family protein [Capsulimonas corticalis]|nr:DUF6262 family protein [Capsulimonas corticalis]
MANSRDDAPRSKQKQIRIPGVKPADPKDRAAQVAQALRDLERIGAAFSVTDVCDRTGISRATIYRHKELRDLIGARGDAPRKVDAAVHEKLESRHHTMKAKARDLRRQLAETETSWEVMRERALQAERRLGHAEQRIEELSQQLARATQTNGSSHALDQVARELGAETVRRAKRQLARALHPDLFAKDAAAAALATEILKALNAL